MHSLPLAARKQRLVSLHRLPALSVLQTRLDLTALPQDVTTSTPVPMACRPPPIWVSVKNMSLLRKP